MPISLFVHISEFGLEMEATDESAINEVILGSDLNDVQLLVNYWILSTYVVLIWKCYITIANKSYDFCIK